MKTKNEIILGCMHIGGSWNDKPATKEEKQNAFRTLDAAVENGITRFDHADIYTFGKSEKVFGEWLKANPGLRSELQIQSKAGIMLGKARNGSNYYCSEPSYLIQQCRQSIENLQCDYLDAFLIHRPDMYTAPESIAESFNTLHTSGEVKTFGLSNMTNDQIENIRTAWTKPIIGNQIEFSLAHPDLLERNFFENTETRLPSDTDHGMLQYLQLQNMELQAYSPLAQGLYTSALQANDSKAVAVTKQLVSDLSKQYQCSKEAVVLAWIFKLPVHTSAVIGTGKPERIMACTQALHIELSHQDAYNLLVTARNYKLP